MNKDNKFGSDDIPTHRLREIYLETKRKYDIERSEREMRNKIYVCAKQILERFVFNTIIFPDVQITLSKSPGHINIRNLDCAYTEAGTDYDNEVRNIFVQFYKSGRIHTIQTNNHTIWKRQKGPLFHPAQIDQLIQAFNILERLIHQTEFCYWLDSPERVYHI